MMGISGIGWASICALPFAMLSQFIKKGTKESLQQMYDMWEYIKEHNEKAFSRLKGGIAYSVMNLFGKPGREIALISYAIMQKIFGFN